MSLRLARLGLFGRLCYRASVSSAGAIPSDLMPSARVIAAAWGVVALAYTPALMMTGEGPSGGAMSFGVAFLFVLLGFVPWALATPLLLSLAWRAPLGSGSNFRSLALLALSGLAALPLLSLAGSALGQAFGGLIATGRIEFDPARVARAALITGFFSVPTFVAVIGVGQTIVYIDRTRTRERLLARARLEALRAQIDPHFLFNALGAIAQLAHRDAERAEVAISRLADVLRTRLSSEAETVALADEIGTVMDHVELHRMLLPAPVDLRLAIAPEARGAAVPAMILQPLVENAVTHGLSRMQSDLWLSISAEARDGRLRIEVANAHGAGRGGTRGLGIGLANVGERLAAVYGEAGRLSTAEAEGSFTATIELPLTQAADERA